jgi:hypothetical protein
MITSGTGESPTAALARMKPMTPTRKTRRRPRVSPSRPAMTGISANARMYPLTTHCSCAGPAPVARPIDGSATLVTLTSSRAQNWPISRTTSARQRCGSSGLLCASSTNPVNHLRARETQRGPDLQPALLRNTGPGSGYPARRRGPHGPHSRATPFGGHLKWGTRVLFGQL